MQRGVEAIALANHEKGHRTMLKKLALIGLTMSIAFATGVCAKPSLAPTVSQVMPADCAAAELLGCRNFAGAYTNSTEVGLMTFLLKHEIM